MYHLLSLIFCKLLLARFLLLEVELLLVSSVSSPSSIPQGFSGSMRSKNTFTMAVSGMDKNMPATPHNAPPINTTMIEISPFIFTFEATIEGTMLKGWLAISVFCLNLSLCSNLMNCYFFYHPL